MVGIKKGEREEKRVSKKEITKAKNEGTSMRIR